jgi:Zn-dependent protease
VANLFLCTSLAATLGLGTELLAVGSAADLRRAGIFVICMILAIGVHEFAHAYAAHRLGDRTPESQGRLTLNPVAHMDPIGTLALPLVLGLSNTGFVFGWGRPVEHVPRYFTRKITMRAGTAIVAFAGPVSNLLQALLTLGLMYGLTRAGVLDAAAILRGGLEHPLRVFYFLNILLFAFNLLPLHPLDGGKVLAWALGARHARVDELLLRWGQFIIIGLVLLPFVTNGRVDPLGWLFGPFFALGERALQAVLG